MLVSVVVTFVCFAIYSLHALPCHNLMLQRPYFIYIFFSFIVIITFINSFSVKLATKVQNVFTAAKLVAIVIIVAGGIYKLAQGNTQYLSGGFEGTNANFGDIATAFYSGLWAYDGW